MNSAALKITELGHRGDGVAMENGAPVFIPYVLPDEIVEAEGTGERRLPHKIIESSPHRAAPYCPWFMRCGGCALQHASRAFELEWKRGLVAEALKQRGISVAVDACIDAHGEGRRRVTLHVRLSERGTEAGFMAARTHDLVAIDHCPLLVPALRSASALAADIGHALAAKKKPLDVQITAARNGLDMDVRGSGEINAQLRQKLIELAARRNLVRLSLHGDLIFAHEMPVIETGPALVEIPAGGFLQATALAEEILSGLVMAGLGKSRAVLDLFSGCGPFALRIARQARVHAMEYDKAAIAALQKAVRITQGLKPLTAEMRDLYRRPVLAGELAPYDAVVFDPPRNGAEAQARELAKPNRLKTVIAVSCNPASFARDARLLCDGGWRLEKVTPVDQFRHAAHVELVAIFRR